MKIILNRKIVIFLLIGILIGIGAGKWYGTFKQSNSQTDTIFSDSVKTASETVETNKDTEEKIPSKVFEVLKYVETFHEPKEGYVGGRVFHNYEGLLPKHNAKGEKIKYREWDVNPKKGVLKRGKERLVTGDDKSAWYTNDHYKSFIKIR